MATRLLYCKIHYINWWHWVLALETYAKGMTYLYNFFPQTAILTCKNNNSCLDKNWTLSTAKRETDLLLIHPKPSVENNNYAKTQTIHPKPLKQNRTIYYRMCNIWPKYAETNNYAETIIMQKLQSAKCTICKKSNYVEKHKNFSSNK